MRKKSQRMLCQVKLDVLHPPSSLLLKGKWPDRYHKEQTLAKFFPYDSNGSESLAKLDYIRSNPVCRYNGVSSHWFLPIQS